MFLYLGGLVGRPTWKGTHPPIADVRCHFEEIIRYVQSSESNLYSCRLMKSQTVGDTASLEYMRGRRVFEINPEHPIIKNLNVRWTEDTDVFINIL